MIVSATLLDSFRMSTLREIVARDLFITLPTNGGEHIRLISTKMWAPVALVSFRCTSSGLASDEQCSPHLGHCPHVSGVRVFRTEMDEE